MLSLLGIRVVMEIDIELFVVHNDNLHIKYTEFDPANIAYHRLLLSYFDGSLGSPDVGRVLPEMVFQT